MLIMNLSSFLTFVALNQMLRTGFAKYNEGFDEIYHFLTVVGGWYDEGW
jgi:hypothetical protein